MHKAPKRVCDIEVHSRRPPSITGTNGGRAVEDTALHLCPPGSGHRDRVPAEGPSTGPACGPEAGTPPAPAAETACPGHAAQADPQPGPWPACPAPAARLRLGRAGSHRAAWPGRPPAPPRRPPHSLGHGAPWQPFVSRPLPLQVFPPIWGTGELQSRIRVTLPRPQVAEQDDQGDQWLQPPFCRTSTHRNAAVSGGPPTGPDAGGLAGALGQRAAGGADPPHGDGRVADTHSGCHTCPGCMPASGWTGPSRCCW